MKCGPKCGPKRKMRLFDGSIAKMNALNLEQFGKLLALAQRVPVIAKISRRVKWEDSGKGILWPHLSEKDFDALMSAPRPDGAGNAGSVDVLGLSNVRQSPERQMGIAFPALESSPGPRGAKGRRRNTSGNNRRSTKEGQQSR
jgi:hypothetical protein